MTYPIPFPSVPDSKTRDELELQWLERIREDDTRAFEALFHAYVEPLCAFAYSYVQSQATAQEIVQDLVCRLWERRRSLNVPRNVHAYLYGAIRNRAINHLRGRRVEQAFQARALRQENARHAALPTSLAEQERELEATAIAEAVEQAVAEMSGRCREVFTLTRDQGLTYAETAAALHISQKTVETHMGRALAFLRRRLAPWLDRG